MDNFLRKELCLSKYKAYNLGNFSTFADILKILHPQCIKIPVRTPPDSKESVNHSSFRKVATLGWGRTLGVKSSLGEQNSAETSSGIV